MTIIGMRYQTVKLLVLACAVLLAACAPSTGITGRVNLGPTCPANTNCTYPSGPASVQVSNDRGDPVASVMTDAAGNFKIPLPAGTYVVQAQRGKGVGPGYSSPPVVVDVTAGHYALVRLSLAS